MDDRIFVKEWLELLGLIRDRLRTLGGLEELDPAVLLSELRETEVEDLLGSTDIEIPQQWARVNTNKAKATEFIVHNISVRLFSFGRPDEPIPLRAVIFVLLHELAHSVATPEMRKVDYKGRARRHAWQHHDHNEDFYEAFERILRTAENLEILQLSQAFGGGGMSRKRARRIDSYELPGILDFVRLGAAVPRLMADHDGFPLLTAVFDLGSPSALQDQKTKLIQNFEDGPTAGEVQQATPKPQPLRLSVSHSSKGNKVLMVTAEDLTVERLTELIDAKFRLKKSQVLDAGGSPFTSDEKLQKFILAKRANEDIKIK